MRFKVGDKVKFLNENGGGTVRAIIDNRMVKVETDNGFDMPVLATELIPDFRSQPKEEIPFTRLPGVATTPKAVEEEPEESRISEINPWGKIREEEGIYLAFEPHEQQWVLTGDLDVMVLNQSSYEVLYNLMLDRDGNLTGIDYGSIPARSKILVDTIGREEIEGWCSGFMQLMFHHDQPKKLFLPAHIKIDIKPSRFFTEGSYRSNTLLQGKALIISISPLNALETATGSDTEQKFGTSATSSSAIETKQKPLIDKHRTQLFEAEIDLHIGEITDNILGLSSHDMFNMQLAYFRKMLDSAIKNDYRKVTFIHGVGNGVLKNAIIKELSEYEGIENRMASISKFGVGAIDILIKNRD